MEKYMKEKLKIKNLMEKVNSFIKMEIIIQENGKMTNPMDKVSSKKLKKNQLKKVNGTMVISQAP